MDANVHPFYMVFTSLFSLLAGVKTALRSALSGWLRARATNGLFYCNCRRVGVLLACVHSENEFLKSGLSVVYHLQP